MKKEELIKKVVEVAESYERENTGCAQCVLGSFKTVFNTISDDVFKAGTGLCGGIGGTGNACGALTGGVMVLSVYLGREFDNFEDPGFEMQGKNRKLVKELYDFFIDEYGGITCKEVQKAMLGRSYDFFDEKELAEWEESTAHEVECPMVVGRSVKLITEILIREGLIEIEE
ncbi:MAG: C-GCAxxG-C-C family protein [Halanaerobiales bacterium]